MIHFKNLHPFALIISLISTSFAQVNEFKLVASDGAKNHYFGKSVAIDNEYAVIGASWTEDRKGSVYIFSKDENMWIEETKLVASDGETEDYFGEEVDVSGDFVIVGSPYDDGLYKDSGSAFIFHRTGGKWTLQEKLNSDAYFSRNNFGQSVSIDGNYAIIGASGDNDVPEGSGSAYIFVRSGTSWNQQAKLTAKIPQKNAHFGTSVSISNNYAIIGAPFENYSNKENESVGAVYVFKRIGKKWLQTTKLSAKGTRSSSFGKEVSISGDNIIVSAKTTFKENSIGAVYIFHKNQNKWLLESKLISEQLKETNAKINRVFFGSSVTINENYAIVGAMYSGFKEKTTGSASVYHRVNKKWLLLSIIRSSDIAPLDYFGCAASISKNYYIIGAAWKESKEFGTGSAYIYPVRE
ncbi:MAG: hypothetical protein DWQ06_13345 [Calditrichaeota bacterium]|nr:MAG: hypothetical protein DWQ06_13345 [Calditrichota bacterium]